MRGARYYRESSRLPLIVVRADVCVIHQVRADDILIGGRSAQSETPRGGQVRT
jgi:hypothetical protein